MRLRGYDDKEMDVCCFCLICEALPRGCTLQADPYDSSRIFVVSETTKQPLSLYDVLQSYRLDIEDVPSNPQDCEKYFQQYQRSNADSLKYTFSFWNPVARTGIEIEFCCLDESMISGFEKKLKLFLQFIKSTDDDFFKVDIFDKYFSQWRKSLNALEEEASGHNVNAFHFKKVRDMLNSLLLIVDAEKLIVEWRF